MTKTLSLAVSAVAIMFAAPAQADPIVDGAYDAEYGAADSTVLYNPAAPTSNFGAPTNQNASAGYSIFLTGGASELFGFFQADRDSGLQFANLYFDIDPPSNNGSDLGFEIGRNGVNAFVPGRSGSVSASNVRTAFTNDGTAIEFAIPYTLFSAPIAGLDYYPGQIFPGPGDSVVLRLSQSFGYSVAGGPTYGPNRLGAVTLPGASAVPEAATWAMMILGFGMVGYGLRRRPAVRFAPAA